MSDSVLKAYLIKLGFKVDESGQRKLQESMQGIAKGAIGLTKNFAQLGASVVGSMAAAAAGMHKVADKTDSVFYAAKRLHSSVREIKDISDAFENMGVSADETRGALEAFRQIKATTPGFAERLGISNLSGNDVTGMLQVLRSLSQRDDRTAAGHARAANLAEMSGISENMLTQYEADPKAVGDYFLKADAVNKQVDNEKNAAALQKVNVEYRRTERQIGNQIEKNMAEGAPAMEKVLKTTDSLVSDFNKLDDATGGWLGKLTDSAGVLAAIAQSYKVIGALRGLGAGATVAEGAGVAGAGGVAATGGIMATLGVLAEMIPDIGAAYLGSKALNKVTKGTFWDTDQAAAPGQKETGLKDQFSGLTKSLASFVAGFEGHAKNGYGTYKDIAGHLTAGYGHLVKPGEDFSKLDKQGALALLTKDLQSAGDSVKQLVKVSLNPNQLKALTSFVFNEGAAAFKNSTLLKDINSGNTAAIGADFARFNKIHQGGHLVANEGLSRRRADEANMYNTPEKQSIVQHNDTKIYIESSKDATATGKAVAMQQDRVHQSVTRNLQQTVS